MKSSLFAIAMLVISVGAGPIAIAQSDPLAADSPCRRCSIRSTDCEECTSWTEVGVDAVSSDAPYASDAAALDADYAMYAPPSPPRMETRVILTRAIQLREVLLRLARECKRVSYLHISAHGMPGGVFLGEGEFPFSVIHTNEVLNGLSCAMAPSARVHLTSCYTGRGCEGEDFMRVLAYHLLRERGGAIVANDDVALQRRTILGFSSASFDLSGGPQRLTVGPGLSSPDWRLPTRSAEECATDLGARVTRLRAMDGTLAGCPGDSVFDTARIRIQAAIDELRAQQEVARARGTADIARISQSYREGTIGYYRAIREAEYLAEEYETLVGACESRRSWLDTLNATSMCPF